MKNGFILSIVASIALPIMANDDTLKSTGEKFCYDIINAVSPGSNHVMDCLCSVRELIESGITDQRGLIMAICERAPNFAYSMGACTEQECLVAARDEYLQ